jgi:hypothetical protein
MYGMDITPVSSIAGQKIPAIFHCLLGFFFTLFQNLYLLYSAISDGNLFRKEEWKSKNGEHSAHCGINLHTYK